MESNITPITTTAEHICDAIGRKVIADYIGASLQAVSNASAAGKFSPRWYKGIRALCVLHKVPCPDSAFSFIDIKPLPRRAVKHGATQ